MISSRVEKDAFAVVPTPHKKATSELIIVTLCILLGPGIKTWLDQHTAEKENARKSKKYEQLNKGNRNLNRREVRDFLASYE